MDSVTAYIGLGSNLGDRRAMIEEALRRLKEVPGIKMLGQSTIVETNPVGPVQNQPDFLNMVVAIETALPALDLLDVLLSIEQAMGRVREERWGPRLIDLDLLLYGSSAFDHPRLKLPHPEIPNRSFVLSGLSELGAKSE